MTATQAPLPRITLIATGGTIAGACEDALQQQGYRAGALAIDHLLKQVPGLATVADIHAEQLFAIDSASIEYSHWQQLAERLKQLLADPGVHGAVVLHGTDTLEETAYFLHLTVPSAKPIVLTGAMRPATAISADGPMNLYHAVTAAAHPDCRGLGALVVFGDTLLAARGMQKCDSVPDAFGNGKYGRLGLIKGRAVFLYQRPVRAPGDFQVPATVPNVALLYGHVGLDPEMILQVGRHCDGLVFAGVGNGNLHPAWQRSLTELAARGVCIVRTSRVANGTTVHNGDIDDDRAGFISADNLPPVQARVLLMLALSKTRDPRVIQQLFDMY